jgi:hypothetical protein
LAVKDIQSLLANDESLVIVDLGARKSYIWAITQSENRQRTQERYRLLRQSLDLSIEPSQIILPLSIVR